MAGEEPDFLQKADTSNRPAADDNLFNRAFAEIIPGGSATLRSIKAKLSESAQDFADQLIKQGDKQLKSTDTKPAETKRIYQTALGVQQLFAPAKDLVPTLDRLADQSEGIEAIKYRERTLAIEKMRPSSPVSLAARHTELAGRYAAIQDREQSAKHFNLATMYWRDSVSKLKQEQLGDAALSRGDSKQVAQLYTNAQSELSRELLAHCSRRSVLPPNPLEAELNRKMAESILSRGPADQENMQEASRRYEMAANNLYDYSQRFGQGNTLPEELELLASALKIECRLATNGGLPEPSNPDNIKDLAERLVVLKEGHLRNENAIRLLTILADRESKCQVLTEGNKGNNYRQNDGCLLPKFTEIAKILAGEKFHKESANVWERVYSMQTTQGESVSERINTIEKIAEEYFHDVHLPVPEAVVLAAEALGQQNAPDSRLLGSNALKKMIQMSEKEYKNDYTELTSVIERAADSYQKHNFYKEAAETLEKLYSIQTAQNRITPERISTLEEIAKAYFQVGMKTKGGIATDKIIELAINEYGEQDQRFIPTVQHVADFCSEMLAFQYAAHALEKLYAAGLDKMSSQEKIDALQNIVHKYFLADKVGKGVEAFEKMIKIAGNDKNLYHLLQPPESINYLDKIAIDEKPGAESLQLPKELYKFSDQLKRVADLQDSYDPTKPVALKNYLNAANVLNVSLARGLEMNPTVATGALNLVNFEARPRPGVAPDDPDELKRHQLTEELSKKVFDWIMKDPVKNGAPFISIFDQIAKQCIEQQDYKQAAPHLERALSLVRAVHGSEDNNKILGRFRQLAYIQADLGQKKEAIATLQEALKFDENTGHFWQDGVTIDKLISLYEDTQQFGQSLDLSQKALDKQMKEGRTDLVIENRLTRARLFEKQGNIDAAKNELIANKTLAQSSLEKILQASKNGGKQAELDAPSRQFLSAYSNLASFYVQKEQYANAESVYRDLIKQYESFPMNSLIKAYLNTYWESLATTCEQQGHAEAAKQAREQGKKYAD